MRARRKYVPRHEAPREPGGFEEQTAAQLRTLWVIVIVLAVAVALVAGLGAYGFVKADDATRQAGATARAEAVLAQQVARAALASASAIKADRNSYVLRECRDQNRRHANTIRYIHSFGRQQARRLHIWARVEDRRLRPFVLLMDAAIPHRDCRQMLAHARGH